MPGQKKHGSREKSGHVVTCESMPTAVNAHITGTVWKIEVKEGDWVDEGQVCVILESMKMEMPVESPEAGEVEKVHVVEGQAVAEGQLLVTLVARA
jgi:acetyl-CoA carboxylase biotin carboxyl carrier protein